MIDYGKSINAIDFEESGFLFSLIILDIFKVCIEPHRLKGLCKGHMDMIAFDFDMMKEISQGFHNVDKDDMYMFIAESIKSNNEQVILFIKSTLARGNDWYLLSDQELKDNKTIPYIIDPSYHLFLDHSDKDCIQKQSDNNREHIIGYLGYRPSIKIKPALEKGWANFYEDYKDQINEFKYRIKNLVKDKGYIHERITNKSAGFYGLNLEGTNSYVENIIEYDSKRIYRRFRNVGKKFYKIAGEFDYVRVNKIKNKANGIRFIFFTNSQINSFLKPFNTAFEKSFRDIECFGQYDQDKAIRRMISSWEALGDVEKSALCLDVSKYSDTMPISLFRFIIEKIIDDPLIVEAVCEVLNLPILWDGVLYNHNVTCQGMYFDFDMITIINALVQYTIAAEINKDLEFASVCGDDSVLIVQGSDHKRYAEKGREIWALLGCKVNKKKAISCNQKEGVMTYLKYRGQIVDGELINISGLSPNLLFKNVISFNRITSIIRYLKKSQYLGINANCENLICDFYNMFKEDIRIAYHHMRISKEDTDYIIDNFLELMQKRPFLLGGFKEYNMNIQDERRLLVSDLKDLKYYYTSILYNPSDTSVPVIERICEEIPCDKLDTVLGNDLSKFISEEYTKIFQKMIRFIDKSDEFIEGSDIEVRDLLDCLKSLNDRRFDKYKSSGLTTDRTAKQRFEDQVFQNPESKFDDLYCLLNISTPTSDRQKSAVSIVLDMANNRNIIRTSFTSDNLMIDTTIGTTIHFRLKYKSGRYVSLDEVLWEGPDKDKYLAEIGAAIVNTVSKKNKNRALEMFQKDPSLIESCIREMQNVETSSRKITKVADDMIERELEKNRKLARESIEKIRLDVMNKYVRERRDEALGRIRTMLEERGKHKKNKKSIGSLKKGEILKASIGDILFSKKAAEVIKLNNIVT